MPVLPSRSRASTRRRIRHLTTLGCVLAGAAGLLALLNGHLIHGGLMLLAGTVLVPGSIWGRRHRAHQAPAAAFAAPAPTPRRWRKAA